MSRKSKYLRDCEMLTRTVCPSPELPHTRSSVYSHTRCYRLGAEGNPSRGSDEPCHSGPPTYGLGLQFLRGKTRVLDEPCGGLPSGSKCFTTPRFLQTDFLKQLNIY